MHLHEGEHGLGGGEEFGVGDVADDFGWPMAVGRTKERRAAAVLLVGGGEGY